MRTLHYLMTIEEKYQRFKGLQKDLDICGMDSMRDTQKEFLDYNKEQMLSGEGNDGQKMGEYAFPWYADTKFKMNPRADGNVDLYLTGSFQAGMFMDISAKNYVIKSTDGKTAKLLGWYPNAFGLNKENLDEYRNGVFFDAFMKRVRRQVNG